MRWSFRGMTSSGVLVIIAVVSGSAGALQAQGADRLYGTWRLTTFRQTVVATGETKDLFGKAPRGFLTYGRDGRMMVLIVKDERPKPTDITKITDQERVGLFKTMMAYGGTYSFDGKTVTHHVDISFNQAWTGTDFVRSVELDGRKLLLKTGPQPSTIDGTMGIYTLTWEKVE